jgi:ring-1,2-phenylacetyl-CoA epoxidase subunit PaaA
MTTLAVQGEPDTRLATRYERWDDLPDGYAEAAARIASFQALGEIVGVLPFWEWIDRVPDYTRKQMLIAKVQDEVGHGQVTARVAEDLGVPRERIIDDFLEGRAKLLNVFHYGFETWEELGPAALVMNTGAIVQFKALEKGTYLPYSRAVRKIQAEESFHFQHAYDMTHQTMVHGTPEQRERVHQAVETWLPRMIAYFGPSDPGYRDNPLYRFGLKVESNDSLRQAWLSKLIPVLRGIGIHVDPSLVDFDEETGQWTYAPPDWADVKRVLHAGGPRYDEWRSRIADSIERNARYRKVWLAA